MATEIPPAAMEEPAGLPYWRVNIPKSEWPQKCPDFLLDVSERDREILLTLDDQYHRATWVEVQECIASNQLERFNRLPSDLRRYLAYIAKIKEKHGSVMNFIVEKRLQWTDREPKDADPFSDPDTDDISILYNDWPYGVDTKIIHLVVWTKFELEEDPSTGDLTAGMRWKIDEYVERTFRRRVQGENVIWFKNWAALKSIHAVEHFHVMLYDPDEQFVKEVTKGDKLARLIVT